MVKDYQKTKIYKVYNNENDKFYIGHTVTTLSKRIGKHREKHSNCMTKNLGVELKDIQIVLIEKYPCKDVDEAKLRERYYIEKYQKEGLNIVNKNIPGRSVKEYNKQPKMKEYQKKWREENKEYLKQIKKEWSEKNKERVSKKNKEWYLNNLKHNKDYDKKRYEKNKEKLRKQSLEYYQKNKEKIQERRKNKTIEKVTCECGITINKYGLSRHKKSKSHIKFLESNN